MTKEIRHLYEELMEIQAEQKKLDMMKQETLNELMEKLVEAKAFNTFSINFNRLRQLLR